MEPNSFTFGTKNSLEFGIEIVAYDVFSAPKRDRRVKIPFRHGTFDQGRKYFEDRILRLECRTERRELTKAEMREVIFWLSQKSIIRLWDEPDKFYIGEIMESAAVDVFAQRVMQHFTLPFLCEPFAYGRQVTEDIKTGANPIEYRGTAQAPTLFVIRNPNDFPVTNITISAVRQVTS